MISKTQIVPIVPHEQSDKTAGIYEVVVSGTVKDLVVGAGFRFDNRGKHLIEGVSGEWRLFSVI